MGNRREAMQVVAGAALVGTVCAATSTSAEPAAPGPVVVLAGKNTEEKGFKVKEVEFKRGGRGFAVIFDKPLAKTPIVVVTPCGGGRVTVGVQDVSEKGFTVSLRLQGVLAEGDFYFIVVLV